MYPNPSLLVCPFLTPLSSASFQAATERRSREVSDQAANRFRAAQQLEERVRRETGKETEVLREGLSRLEAEVERLRLEGERTRVSAQQDTQKQRCGSKNRNARSIEQLRSEVFYVLMSMSMSERTHGVD